MAFKEIAVKKYVVRLSKGEREELQELIRKRKRPAKQQLKALILLKADVSKRGEGWSDSKIIKALNTSVSMVYRVRQQQAKSIPAQVHSGHLKHHTDLNHKPVKFDVKLRDAVPFVKAIRDSKACVYRRDESVAAAVP